MPLSQRDILARLYRTLEDAWGPQHWWPAASPFEVIIGAFLTQNTAWKNVELAIGNLRSAGLLNVEGIRKVPLADLQQWIRPSGYFRQKSERLKHFVRFLDDRYGGSLEQMFARPTGTLRCELLALNGIGPETADSILLYAGHHPVFVVDAYTRRILDRHAILRFDSPYEEIRTAVESALAGRKFNSSPIAKAGSGGAVHEPSPMSLARCSPTTHSYKEMHALIVGVGKNYCFKAKPNCESCPLRPFLPD